MSIGVRKTTDVSRLRTAVTAATRPSNDSRKAARTEMCAREPSSDRFEETVGRSHRPDEQQSGDEHERWPGLPGCR
jgi:hypothetical protein